MEASSFFTAYTSTGAIQFSHSPSYDFIEYEYIAKYLPTDKEVTRTVWVPTVAKGDALLDHWNNQNPFVWTYFQP